MNPNDFNVTEPSTPPEDGGEQQDVTMPLGTGDFGGQEGGDAFVSTTPRKTFSGGSLLVVAVILIAIGGLYAMRTLAQVTAATAIDADIESTIENFLRSATGEGGENAGAANANRDGAVIAVLSEAYSERQIPLDDVQRDPFIIYETAGTAHADQPDDQSAAELAAREARFNQEKEARRRQIEQAGQSLRIRSVLAGANPLANINGDVVRVGDTLLAGPNQIEFKVAAIATGSVEIVAEDPRYDLTVTVTLRVQHNF